MLKRILYLLSFVITIGQLHAQVTNSSISGVVKSPSNEPLVGATITALHEPTQTVFRIISQREGIFNIVNMIPGGPYNIEISFAGYESYTQSDLVLALGENTRVDGVLGAKGNLQEVVVTGTSSVRRKTGASTNISKQQIEALPTLSRSLSDITRITPQANGNSFGGASNRFNNITIDGAVNNDVFGLASNGTPGGQANTTPISLDAIQEVQVVLAPYDITYGNFTGAGVNAVTRSGTNKFDGSVYLFSRNENTVGKDPISRIKTAEFKNQQYGARIGGPIIKNKLFFFLNAELSRIEQPTIFNAGETGALLTVAEAQALVDTLKRKY